MSEFDRNPDKEENIGNDSVEMSEKDLSEIMLRFSGIDENGVPKSVVTYSAYDYDAPEDDPDKNNVFTAEDAKVELSVDWRTGFYTLDLIFDSPENRFLKMMWAKLQRHKSNEVYMGDKLWVFYISLMETGSALSGEKNKDVFVANIMNPVLFFLTRQVPNQDAGEEFETELGSGCYLGGNCIRMLLHKDLVKFKYIPSEELEEE